jgi:phosphatidylglycerophosphate synthase
MTTALDGDLDLAAAAKPVDSWWTVAVVDPLAMRVLPFLLRRPWATPNVVTAAAFVVGLVSIALFATGHWVLAAVMYELRFFLDCLDGKIARVRRLSSPAGALFDRLADMVSIPTAYAAIGFVLADQGHLSERLALLLPALALLVAGFEAVLEVVRLRAPAPDDDPNPRAAGLVGWARRHRLTLRPWTVEAETLGLFLGPLLLRGGALGGLHLLLAGVYVLYAVVDLVLMFSVIRPPVPAPKS